MSYTPTNWANGTTPLNAVNMNKIEQGIVGVNTGKLNKIPTITFTDEQVISTETKSVNVTQDQAAILGSEDNPFVYLICDLLEIDGIYTTSWRHYVSEELEAVWFSKVDTVDPARGGMSVSQLRYIHPDRTGNFLYCGIYPANKTVDMTESVGVDSDGRLWTTPGAQIPTITIAASQYNGLTTEQYQRGEIVFDQTTQCPILENTDNNLVYIDMSACGIGKALCAIARSGNGIFLSAITSDGSTNPGSHFFMIEYGITLKTGWFKGWEFRPAVKDSSMTQSVGMDYSGKLWTTPSSSSTATTASLTVAGWSNNSQTVNVTGVTASNNIIVAPAPASQVAYTAAGIICTAQGSGTLTFTCATVPAAAITVNVLIVG